MNRWGTRNQEENTPNFKDLFNNHPHAIDLLSLPNFAEDAKSNSTSFTQLLIAPKNLHYLFELIEIAINPQNFTSTTKRTLNNKMTHAAIDIITNLSEDFMDLVFEGEQDDEDEVVQTQRDYPILSTIFKIASEGQLQSTGLAYFSKIVTPFIYQKPAEMIGFFSEQAFPLVIRYFWSSEMCELATKLLEAETEKNFFEAQKINFVRKLLKAIQNYQEPNSLEETMENLPSFMQTLVDKHEDKYEKAKYASLIDKIVQESQIFLFLVSYLEKYKSNSLIKSQLLHSIQAYLKIHLPTSSNGKGQDQQSQPEPIKLNINMADALEVYLSNHPVNEFISDIRMQLLNYYKVIKVFISVYPQSTDRIVSNQFLVETMKIMKREFNNNILHNLMKEVIFKGLVSEKVHKIVKNHIGLLQELKINITQTNCKNSYSTQLFLITQALLKQNHTNSTHQTSEWSTLEQKIINKRKFLAMPIATNKDNQDDNNWDNFDSEIIIKAEHPFDNNGKLTSLIKPKPINNQPFTMVTRLDEIEGTEVLSEEEDGFTNNDPAKTNHFYDDLGMPDLPLDSDRSEEGELKADSLQNIPQNAKQNSTVNVKIPGEQGEQELPETLNENSQNEGNQSQSDQSDQFGFPETLGSDSIKIKGAQFEEDGFPETLGQNSNKKIPPFQQDKSAGQIYIQNLGPQVEQFEFKPNSSQLVFTKEQELSLEGLNQMTVSINIAEELTPETQEKVRFRQEIEMLLYGKYQLDLAEDKQ